MGSHLSDVWFRTTDLEVVSGSGCIVHTADGTEYLDFTAGIAVASTGHSHPRVVDAIREQAGQIMHAQANCYRSPLPEQLATRLAQITPPSIDSFFFTNSGAEATEAAVKLARHATGRPNVIVVQGGFHGRTYLTMAMTTSKVGRARRLPAAPGRRLRDVVPAPVRVARRRSDRGRARARRSSRCCCTRRPHPSETAAFVMEPVLGEGGYLPAPIAFVRGVRRDLRRARHPVRRRRGADRLRAYRAHVRGGALGGRARHHGDGEGHRVGLPDRGDRRPRRAHGALEPRRARRHLRRQPDGLRGRARHHRRDPRRAARHPIGRARAAS